MWPILALVLIDLLELTVVLQIQFALTVLKVHFQILGLEYVLPAVQDILVILQEQAHDLFELLELTVMLLGKIV